MKLPVESIREEFGERLELNAPLARLTSARLGGPADALVTVNSAAELVQAAAWLWANDLPWLVIGGGSNLLISDNGVRGVVVLNRARRIKFDESGDRPSVWAESGANFGLLARQAASRGLAGLEWAVGIPGTVGGAVVGNAGAHGGDMAGCLLMAEILQRNEGTSTQLEQWSVERLEYEYRSSVLKRGGRHVQTSKAEEWVVTRAQIGLSQSTVEAVQKNMDRYTEHRRSTQPPGATMGSMFKNPGVGPANGVSPANPGDSAGRLIDLAGLKGSVIGDAQISPLHGNFFLNRGKATAADIYGLIKLAQRVVYEKFGVELELEIELVGEWEEVRVVK